MSVTGRARHEVGIAGKCEPAPTGFHQFDLMGVKASDRSVDKLGVPLAINAADERWSHSR
jgi:hypothetical protein